MAAFEEDMAKLEEVVRGLETGSLPLEESFDAYKRGMELYKALKARLDEGEAQMKILTGEKTDEASGV